MSPRSLHGACVGRSVLHTCSAISTRVWRLFDVGILWCIFMAMRTVCFKRIVGCVSTFSIVPLYMLRARNNLQVFDPIVRSVAVDMMDVLIGAKRSTNVLLYNHAMNANSFIVYVTDKISVWTCGWARSN